MNKKQYIGIIEQALNLAFTKGVFNLQDGRVVSNSWELFLNSYREMESQLQSQQDVAKEFIKDIGLVVNKQAKPELKK